MRLRWEDHGCAACGTGPSVELPATRPPTPCREEEPGWILAWEVACHIPYLHKRRQLAAPRECLSGWESFTGNDPGVMLHFLWGMYLLPLSPLLSLFFLALLFEIHGVSHLRLEGLRPSSGNHSPRPPLTPLPAAPPPHHPVAHRVLVS